MGREVCVCWGIREKVFRWRRGEPMMMDRHGGDHPPTPRYQSSRNVERAGKTWNALLNLRSDVMCEVEG